MEDAFIDGSFSSFNEISGVDVELVLGYSKSIKPTSASDIGAGKYSLNKQSTSSRLKTSINSGRNHVAVSPRFHGFSAKFLKYSQANSPQSHVFPDDC